MAICGAKIWGKQEWCEAEGTMANGRCSKHWRRTEANRLATIKRHDAKRAAGEPARFYELTDKRREDLRNARLGKHWPQEIKDAIGASRSRAHREQQESDREHLYRDRFIELNGLRAPAANEGVAS